MDRPGGELAHHLDPLRPDTTGAYGGDAHGDREALADMAALGALLQHRDAWQSDWSDVGQRNRTMSPGMSAWGAHNAVFAADFGLPGPQYEYHPWYFLDRSEPPVASQDPPGDALTSRP